MLLITVTRDVGISVEFLYMRFLKSTNSFKHSCRSKDSRIVWKSVIILFTCTRMNDQWLSYFNAPAPPRLSSPPPTSLLSLLPLPTRLPEVWTAWLSLTKHQIPFRSHIAKWRGVSKSLRCMNDCDVLTLV